MTDWWISLMPLVNRATEVVVECPHDHVSRSIQLRGNILRSGDWQEVAACGSARPRCDRACLRQCPLPDMVES